MKYVFASAFVTGLLGAFFACGPAPSSGSVSPDPCAGLCTCPTITAAQCCEMGCGLIKTYDGFRCVEGTDSAEEVAGNTCSHVSDAGAPDARRDSATHDAGKDSGKDSGKPACSCSTPGYCDLDGGSLCNCDPATQYCDIIVSGPDGGVSTPVCVALPAQCVGSATCACVQATDGGECADICGTIAVVVHQ